MPFNLPFSRSLSIHWTAVLLGFSALAHAQVNIVVDDTKTHQTIDGFGTLASPLVYTLGGSGDTLTTDQRTRALDATYHQVGVNLGYIGTLLESSYGYSQQQNDDSDPLHINWANFQGDFQINPVKKKVIDLAKPFGFTGYFLGGSIANVRYQSK